MKTFLKCLLNLVLICACQAQIVRIDGCMCPLRTITYQCTFSAPNSSFTVWNVSLLDNDLSLPHKMGFNSFAMNVSSSTQLDIKAQGISISNGSYTSQLTVPARDELQGRTITCSVHYVTNSTLIDMVTFNITQLEPPSNVRLVEATLNVLTFKWESTTDSDCPYVTYLITSRSCGECENETSSTNATCTDFVLPSNCILSVSKMMCGNTSLRSPDATTTSTLQVPDAPEVIDTVPYYSDGGSLIRIETRFHSLVPFNISASVNGSATNYTVFYTDSNGQLCASGTIQPSNSSCILGVCTHESRGLVTQCTDRAATLTTSVYATNVLGMGDNTTLFNQTFGISNQFVSVTLLPNTRGLNCTFFERVGSQPCTCAVNISYDENCETLLGEFTSSGPTDSLTLRVTFRSDVTQYCFVAKGTCGNKAAIVEGTFNIATPDSDTTVIAATLTVMLVAIVIAIVAVIVTVVIYVKKPRVVVAEEIKSPWIIFFSNGHTSGSLAKVIKVFKDLKINIVRVNIPWQESDSLPKSFQTNYVHFNCTPQQRNFIEEYFGQRIEFSEHKGSDGDEVQLETAKLLVPDRPGALWDALHYFETLDINLRGVNTAIMSQTKSQRIKNYVTCVCSSSTIDRLVQELKKAEAEDIRAEHPTDGTKDLTVYVQDGIGNLCRILQVFSERNIRFSLINDSSPVDDTAELQTHLVEYVRGNADHAQLKQRLEEHGACNISEPPEWNSDDSKNVVLKISVRNETGSLATALEAFKACNVEVVGVDTTTMAKVHLVKTKEVFYTHVTVKCTTSKDELVLRCLKNTGYILQPTIESAHSVTGNRKTITFSIIDSPLTLAQAISILAVHCESVFEVLNVRDEHVQQVNYKANYFVFNCSDEELKKLRSSLYDTHLVDSIDSEHSKIVERDRRKSNTLTSEDYETQV